MTFSLWLVVGLLAASEAIAATINVTTTADEFGAGSGCALREAARAAFTNASFGGCSAGEVSGSDDIRLVGGKTYRLTRALSGSDSEGTGDVDVFAPVSVVPTGSALATIDASAANDRAFEFGGNSGQSDVERIRVQGGDTAEDGGAIKASETLLVTDSVIAHNEAAGGGGISSYTNLILTSTTVSDNQAGIQGGGMVHAGGLLVLQDSSVTGNSAGASGGGGVKIHNNAMAAADFDNVTLSGNTTQANGGGALLLSGSLSLANATVSGNRAAGSGGGVLSSADLSSYNSILAGNTAEADTNDDCGGTLNGSFNLIQVLTGCVYFPAFNSDVVGKPAKLGPLADNGGGVLTRALLTGSPAIDAGKPGSGSGECVEHDARLVARSLGGRCDMGAYELVRCADTIVNRVGTFFGRDSLVGTAGADGFLLFDGDDVAKGKGGADRICGGPGKDNLIGGRGKDRLYGEADKDRLLGGRGRDRLIGGPGRDRCLGGPGRDRAKSCSRRIGIP